MSRVPTPRALLNDPAWKYAIVGGLLALPFTIAAALQTPTELSVGPVFGAGLVAGYLYDGRRSERSSVGARAGAISALPPLWLVVDAVPFVVLETASPLWFRAISIVFAIGIVALAVAFAAAIATVGARVGDWVSSKAGRTRPPAAAQ